MSAIPWLEEERKNLDRPFQMEAVGVMIHPKRLLALVAIAEAAQEYSAPEFRRLVEAVERAKDTP